MTKIALITDTHAGVRHNSPHFHDMFKRFVDNVFFPYIDKENIKHVVHLGDVFDERKYINTNTMNRFFHDFAQPLLERNLDVHITVGNHDTHYKTTNKINSVRELLRPYPINIYETAEHVVVGDCPILMLPWMCSDNYEESMRQIQTSTAKVCMGHLEIAGFEMYRGSVVSHGEDRKIFDKFDLTLSGHYHHRSTDGSIYYLGSHGEFTWSDFGDDRGFHILDTRRMELEFIPNPYRMFAKVFYDDSEMMPDISNIDLSDCSGKYVKLIVKNKNNPFLFDVFCQKLDEAGPLDYQTVDDHMNLNLGDTTDIVEEAESTLDTFRKYAKQVDIPNIDSNRLEKTIVDLYNRAITVGV